MDVAEVVIPIMGANKRGVKSVMGEAIHPVPSAEMELSDVRNVRQKGS